MLDEIVAAAPTDDEGKATSEEEHESRSWSI